LRNVDEEMKYLFRTLSILGSQLGPLLFQFPKSFHVDAAALKGFLTLIPHTISCAFEFRSPSWLDVQILDLLREKDAACVPRIPTTVPRMRSSARPHGDTCACAVPTIRIPISHNGRKNIFAGMKKAFVFFKHEEEEAKGGPELATRFQDLPTQAKSKDL
jgi:hypothetical protein